MGLAGRLASWAGTSLIVGLVIALALWRWSVADPVTDKVEGALLDLRFQLRGPRPAPEEIVIVAIDERTVGAIGVYAPMRTAIGDALGIISAAGPRIVAIDLLFVDPTKADGDLAMAIGGSGAVLLAAATTGSRDGAPVLSPEQQAALSRSALSVVIGAPAEEAEALHLLLPNPRLAETGMLAHVNISAGDFASARAVPLSIPVGDRRLLPSMALTAAQHGLGAARDEVVYQRGGAYRIGARTVASDHRGHLILDHYGPASSIRTISLKQVLEGSTPATAFAGKVVFIGSTAASLRDQFATPFGSAVAGVEILATATGNIFEGRQLERGPGALGATVLLAITGALLSAAAFRIGRMVFAIPIALTVWAGAAGVLQFALSEAGLWLDGVTVLGALITGGALGARTRLGREQRQRSNLAHYVAPSLVRQLAETEHPSFDGREQSVGLLFVDVSDYSRMVEGWRPSAVAIFLRDLHRLFEQAADANRGLIVDFQGDGALIVFGMPEPSSDDAANALACGEALLAPRSNANAFVVGAPFRLRVSVHWGPVACAILGGRRHAQVSVTGDAVNLTVRLQEFAKRHEVAFVATRAALAAAGTTHGFERLGFEPLRGRRTDIEIWARQYG